MEYVPSETTAMPGGINLAEWLDYWQSDKQPWNDDHLNISETCLIEIRAAATVIRGLLSELSRRGDANE